MYKFMHHKLYLALILAFLLLGSLILQVSAQTPAGDPQDDEDPTAVGLAYFRGEASNNEVFLEWETGSESGTAGFIIKRSTDSANGPFEQLFDLGDEVDGTNDGFIESRGNPQLGSYYSAMDSQVENGSTYWYQLVEVETSNSQNVLDDLEMFVEPPPIISTAANSGTNTPVPTSTDIPTETPIPSQTPTPTDTPTPTETPTALPDDTVVPPTATVTPRPAGPTPTQFVFPSPTPAGGLIGNGVELAEAAGQPGQEGYPASGSTATPFTNVTIPAQINGTSQDQGLNPYPENGNNRVNGGDTNPINPGSGDTRNIEEATGQAGETGENEQAVETGTTSSRIILWLGLAGGLLILIGGVFFSIALATRRA